MSDDLFNIKNNEQNSTFNKNENNGLEETKRDSPFILEKNPESLEEGSQMLFETVIKTRIKSKSILKSKPKFIKRPKPDDIMKNYLQKKEDVTWWFFLQVCLGLCDLHKNNIAHKGFCYDNIYFIDNKIKISLEGLNEDIKAKEGVNKNRVSHGTEKSDMWTLGCILYEFYIGKSLFDNENMEIKENSFGEYFSKIKDKIQGKLKELELKNLILRLLDKENNLGLLDILKEEFYINKMKEFNLYHYYCDLVKDTKENNKLCLNVLIFKNIFSLINEYYKRSIQEVKNEKESGQYSIFISQLKMEITLLKISLAKSIKDFGSVQLPCNLKNEKIEEYLSKWSSNNELKEYCDELRNFINCSNENLAQLIEKQKDSILQNIQDIFSSETKEPTPTSKSEIITINDHKNQVYSLCLIDDNRFASCSLDKTIKIFNLADGKCEATLEGHSRGVLFVSLTLDNKQLISCSDDRTIKIWDIDSNIHEYKCVDTLRGHTSYVWKANQIGTDKICSCSADGKIIIWKRNDSRYEIEKELITKDPKGIECFIQLEDPAYIVSSSHAKGSLFCWDSSNYQLIAEVENINPTWYGNNCLAVAGKHIIVGCENNCIIVLDPKKIKYSARIVKNITTEESIYSFFFIPDKNEEFLFGDYSGKLFQYNSKESKVIEIKENSHKDILRSILMTREKKIDERKIITCSSEGTIRIIPVKEVPELMKE